MKKNLYFSIILIFYFSCSLFSQTKNSYIIPKNGIEMKFGSKVDSLLENAVTILTELNPDRNYFISLNHYIYSNNKTFLISLKNYRPNNFIIDDTLGLLKGVESYLISKTNRYIILGKFIIPIIDAFDERFYYVYSNHGLRRNEVRTGNSDYEIILTYYNEILDADFGQNKRWLQQNKDK